MWDNYVAPLGLRDTLNTPISAQVNNMLIMICTGCWFNGLCDRVNVSVWNPNLLSPRQNLRCALASSRQRYGAALF